ncbi:MAG: DUF3011 domain-containing protein [Xanthomonadales bacterium]|nr:DUF3011 domain-containing protein [Xanthomonadales bacterium]
MRNTLFLIASVTAAGFTSAPAQAQWSSGGYDDDLIRCESRDGRTERCETYGGNAQFVRQLSNTPCVRGRSWGTDSRGVWVSSGCRAEFRVDSGYGYDNGYDDNSYGYGSNNNYGNSGGAFRCESRDGRTERCNSYGGRAQFVRQLSNTPCVRGRSWGSDSRGVWVSNGCRALFTTNAGYGNNYGNNYGSDLVRCESRDNRSHSCTISSGRNGNIRLLRQLSDKPCIENQTWGRSRTGVWVTQGCRAEFVTGRGNNNSGGGYQRPPGDLGGAPGGKRSTTYQDTSGGREPGDLGGATSAPANQRPPSEVVIGRPGSVERADRQIRPVEEAPGRLEIQTVEEAPGQVSRRNTGGTAEVDTLQPAPRERVVERAERPR